MTAAPFTAGLTVGRQIAGADALRTAGSAVICALAPHRRQKLSSASIDTPQPRQKTSSIARRSYQRTRKSVNCEIGKVT
jgi:hypothetical protein